MELRHLNYFIAVAEELNVTRAAQRLSISQPPLSRQIHDFEEELDVKLFDRTGRQLRLTEAGRFLYEGAKEVVARITELQEATRRIHRMGHRWLNIGFAPSTLYGLLPHVIRSFTQMQPDVEVGLIALTTVEQVEALKSGRIDVAFGRILIDDPAIIRETVLIEPIVAVVPPMHRMAKRRSVDMATLATEHIILYPARPRPGYADQTLAHFRERGLTLRSTREVNDLHAALGMVAAGVGIAMVPMCVQRLRPDDVRYKPIDDAGVTSPVVMMYRRDDDSAALARLCEGVRTHERQRLRNQNEKRPPHST